MLAATARVDDLGEVSMVSGSAPVLAPDGMSVIYVKVVSRQTSQVFPVIARDVRTHLERTLFSVNPNSCLWTLNYSSGSLLLSVADTSGTNLRVVECSLTGVPGPTYQAPSNSDDCCASLSSDESQLAFVRIDHSAGSTKLMVRDAGSGASSVRTLRTFINGETPLVTRWVDNTHVIVGTRAIDGTPSNMIVDVPFGVGTSVLALGLSPTPDPAGHYFLSLFGSGQSSNVWLSLVDGAGLTQLTSSATAKQSPNWSVDGRALVYETISSTFVARLEVLTLPPLE